MFSTFERMIGFRYLRARKSEGFVSVIAAFSFLGIMLGVATLIIVLSVMNGFRSDLIDRILGLNGHINIYAKSGIIRDYDAMSDHVKTLNSVKFSAPVIDSQALLSVRGASTGVAIKGLRGEDFARKPILGDALGRGDAINFRDDLVAIGVGLADNYNLRLGDKITLIAPKGRSTPFGTVPRAAQYTVGVIFEIGMHEYDNGFVIMPLDTARNFLSMGEGVSAIEVIAQDPENLAKVKEDLAPLIGDELKLYDWQQSNSTFINALDVERNVMFLILTLIIIVAAFNIISSMMMLVKDKGKDIAILRSFGATRANIMSIFVLSGGAIGVLGTLFGAGLGVVFAANIETIRQFIEKLSGAELFASEIYFLSQLPAEINIVEVLMVIGMALILSIGATLYPAWRASRLDPVEALRYE